MGHAFNFQTLAKYLPGRTVYGLNFPGRDGITMPARSIPDLARTLVAEILRIQPAGPYRVLGYSFGGVVAFELARQLRAAGHCVAPPILLETFTEKSFRRSAPPLRARIPAHVRRLREQGVSYIFRRIRNRIFLAIPSRFLPKPAKSGNARSQRQVRASDRLVNVLNVRSHRAYEPLVYPDDVTLIMANDPPKFGFRILDPFGGWRSYVGGQLRMRHMPGNHLTVLHDPNVSHLAAIVEACFNDVPTEAAAP